MPGALAGGQFPPQKLCILKQSQLPADVDPVRIQHKTVSNAAVTLWSATWGSPGTTLATTHTLTVRVFKPRANAAAQIAAFKKEAAGLPDARVAKVGSYARWTSGTTGVGVMFLASGYECQVSFVNQASPSENLGRAGEIVGIARLFAARLR